MWKERRNHRAINGYRMVFTSGLETRGQISLTLQVSLEDDRT